MHYKIWYNMIRIIVKSREVYKMKQKKQMSETLLIGGLLALAGGFLDAYTYITRGGVFANAQTGNMVLFGIGVFEGNIKKMMYYIIPILAFFVGIIIAEIVKGRYKTRTSIHWRQIIVVIESVLLFVVALINNDMIANAIVSFVCSLQVESFRKVNGNPYATTMCTGNLRSATENLYKYKTLNDRVALHKSIQYFIIITCFIIGAGIGTIFSKMFVYKAVLFAAAILGGVGVLMIIDNEEDRLSEEVSF